MSKRDYKMVPFCVHGCKITIYTLLLYFTAVSVKLENDHRLYDYIFTEALAIDAHMLDLHTLFN